MYRGVLVFFIILSFMLVGCSQNKRDDNKTENVMDYKIYRMDLVKNEAVEIYQSSSKPWEVLWSDDSRHFLFITEEKLSKKDIDMVQLLHLFNTVDKSEIELPGEINDKTLPYKTAYWADPQKIILNRFTSESNHNYYLFDIDTKRMDYVPKGDEGKYLSVSSKNDEQNAEKYNVPDEVINRIKSKTGLDLKEKIISGNREKVLYNTPEYKTYLYNLKTDENVYLFDGLKIQWSPNETKIKYSVPKNIKLQSFDDKQVLESDRFDSFVFEIESKKSIKVADYFIQGYFSFDDRDMVFHNFRYFGVALE